MSDDDGRELVRASERKDKAKRAAFARRGTLAKAIAAAWDDADAYDATCDDLVERRRRAGELFAGVPDDIEAMATSGRRKDAVAAYAKRYGLSLDVARKVVDANA